MECKGSKQGAFFVLEVSGRMDALTSQGFETECMNCLEAGDTRVVADLGGLEYISSAGLRSILSAAKKLKAGGGDLAFCGLSGIVAEVFTVSGFAKLLPVYATREEALARS
ncbi:MAG: STAS domain-containing protein [Proteobacteria bacterium]|nr:STAS domain-containing protein [Pseudomonadota bacterium]